MKQSLRQIGRVLGTGLGALMLVGLLAGCGQHGRSDAASKKAPSRAAKVKRAKTSTTKKVTKATSSSKPASKTLWTADQEKKLQAFIVQWGKEMGQSYTAYDGKTPLKTSTGTTYPAALKGIEVTAGAGTIGWDPSGTGNYDYHVVAIYNHDGTEPPLPNRITYAFAFRQGKPIVLVDQTRDGSPVLSETQNTALKTGFNQIAAGGTPAAAAKTSGSGQTQPLSYKLVGVLLQAYRGDNVTADQALHVGSNTATYPYIVDSGTAVSQVPFRYTATTVTYGTRDPNTATADNVFIDKTVSIQTLTDQFYKTSAQQAAINAVVARLE